MRKIGLWLLPTLFLFVLGCGGGDQTTSGTTTGGGGEPSPPEGYGLIKLTIHQGQPGAPATDSPQTLAPGYSGTPTAADNVRVAARLFSTQSVEIFDDDGNPLNPRQFVDVFSEVYRKIQDFNITTTSTTVLMAVPAANGYIVEAISSVTGGTDNHIMLKYGKNTIPINVASGGTTTPAALDTIPIANLPGFTITLPALPDNIIANSKYSIPITLDNVPVRRPFYFQQYATLGNGIPTPVLFVDTTSPSFNFITPSFTAPNFTTSPLSGGFFGSGLYDLYFQGLFFISDTWKSDTDKNSDWWKKWKFYYPNTYDPFLRTRLQPLGIVNITINLSPSK